MNNAKPHRPLSPALVILLVLSAAAAIGLLALACLPGHTFYPVQNYILSGFLLLFLLTPVLALAAALATVAQPCLPPVPAPNARPAYEHPYFGFGSTAFFPEPEQLTDTPSPAARPAPPVVRATVGCLCGVASVFVPVLGGICLGLPALLLCNKDVRQNSWCRCRAIFGCVFGGASLGQFVLLLALLH